MALALVARDPRVPWYAKVVAGLVAAYALSPIDLVPDFIPVPGYLDDLILVSLGIYIAVKLVPRRLMAELRLHAERQSRPASRLGSALVLASWIAGAAALTWLFWPGKGA